MGLEVKDARRHIAEWEALYSSEWPLTPEVTLGALDALAIAPERLNEVLLRYVGTFTSTADVVKHLSVRSDTETDYERWPFSHIDWAEAARAADAHVHLTSIGNYWFDYSTSDLYSGSTAELAARINFV